MAHNSHVVPTGRFHDALVPTPAILRRFDQLASECIDGDGGGLWAPREPMVLGGAGVHLSGRGGIAGGLTTGRGAASGGSLVLGDGDVPALSPRSRTVLFPLRNFYARSDASSGGEFYDESDPTGGRFTSGPGQDGYAACLLPSFRLLQGATITSVTLRWSAGLMPTTVPENMPKMRILRIPRDGSYSITQSEIYFIPVRANTAAYRLGDLVLPTPVGKRQFRCVVAGTTGAVQPAAFTTAAVGDAVVDGAVTWRCEVGPGNAFFHFAAMQRPLTPAAYFNAGQPQDLVMIPNANTVVDTASYAYAVDIIDRCGTQNRMHSLLVTMDNIVTLGPTA